jgi:hypothetical protein
MLSAIQPKPEVKKSSHWYRPIPSSFIALLRTVTLAMKAGLIPSCLARAMYSEVSSMTVADSESVLMGKSWARCFSPDSTTGISPSERFSSLCLLKNGMLVMGDVVKEVEGADTDIVEQRKDLNQKR